MAPLTFIVARFIRRHGFKLLSCLIFASLVAVTNHRACAAVMTFNGDSTDEADWQAAAGATSLENFESYSAGVQISSLPALGLSFDELAGGGYPVTYLFSEGPPHGPMQLANFPNGIGGSNQFDDIVAHVLPGYEITAFGYWNGDGQSDTLFATAYDESDNVIATIGAFKDQFAGLVADTAIARIVFDGTTGDGWDHMDGLQTNALAVPEPATVWLLVTGCVGLMMYRRAR